MNFSDLTAEMLTGATVCAHVNKVMSYQAKTKYQVQMSLNQ